MIPTVRIIFSCYLKPPPVWDIIIVNRNISSSFGKQVGFNMRKVTKGNVTIKLWDLGGQRRFRTMWERYCRGVTAIV